MYEAEVARGAALLDKHGPTNWRRSINLGELDLASIQDCVLGQVYAGASERSAWTHALIELGAPPSSEVNDRLNWTIYHGFDAPYCVEIDGRDHDRLQEAWIAYLVEARTPVAVGS